MPISKVIFDIGEVLLGWAPEKLADKLFDDPAESRFFMSDIVHHDWNYQQDLGRSWADAVDDAITRHPSYETQIRAFDERWIETITGPIEGMLDLHEALRKQGIPLYALSNFSREKFILCEGIFPILKNFEGRIISGFEKCAKPDPAIYELLLSRFNLNPHELLFIDDRSENIKASEKFGITGHLFKTTDQLSIHLKKLNLLA
jgi:2-haloacid dehalogenase